MSKVNEETNGNAQPEIAATKALAAFATTATVKQLTPELREKVKEVVIDYIGVVVGGLATADSTEPIYNAIKAFQGQAITGGCTVIGKGEPHMLPQYAGLLNSTFGHSLDFDDTYADGSLHAGVTAISAAMTQAELNAEAASADDFMLAVSVGYEVTCRLGRELGFATYERSFHITSIAGIFGSIAAIAVLRHLTADVVEMAFGLAGSKAAGSMQYLDNGSWNKRLHPGFAVHDAFICVALAVSGVIGATRIIEGKNGFLHAYSPREDKDLNRLVGDLGKEWTWLTSSLKPYPACRMTHTFIELAGNVGSARKVVPSEVSSIKLKMPTTSVGLVGDPIPNKIHPSNHIDAQFSAYFQVANALLYGSATGMQAYQKLQDPDVVALCSKTTMMGDPAMTGFSGSMRIEWTDGHVDEMHMQYPLGEQQHPFIRQKVDEKFLSLVEPVFGSERARAVIQTVDELEDRGVADLLKILR